MIAPAIMAMAAGVLLVGSLAGLRRVQLWARAARAIAIVGTLLAVAGLAFQFVEVASNRLALNALHLYFGAACVAIGGTAYTFHTKSSPFTLFIGGMVLAYATLATTSDASTLTEIAGLSGPIAGMTTLPMLAAAAGDWRGLPVRAGVIRLAWFVVALALIGHAAYMLVERGAWLAATPGAAGLIGAWAASSGSLLARPGRSRAALLAATAVCAAIGALSV
jgi:hypothetical protein